ncbi:UDP-N-acetylglucosamine 1-carboxyvinyltransferase [Blautia sp. MSJ-19]|uniref:UDP-N-acetylglucosamine 1-carboxyvinyltransferase n=1 Tax=Blautia sp. MSJ-19 TaxID=2841517 RepID=UPI001C0EED0C|nr:UDP-N-acetylglucosamine 1-carboxyvinyltransferase [Blautia sp. MSJ-19]
MDEIHIVGGKKICGSIVVQGSKNTVLPLMAASLLHAGVSVLRGCPRITDVFCMEEILQRLGAVTWWKEHDLYLDCTRANGTEVPEQYAGKMRCSVILLGALLGRWQKGAIGYPGGCVIGKRPVDLHLYALRSLGAEITEQEGMLHASARKLKGGEIFFAKKSVGATEQAVLAAVLAEGKTVIRNCAEEPEILWLCRYLRSMGARICGEGGPCIEIEGVSALQGGEMKIPADRIVTGTYLCAAAATRGKVTIPNAPEGELDAFLEVYRKMGGQYEWKSGKLIANGMGIRFPVEYLETAVYPGFPTDLQSPLLAVLATVDGESCIKENIFENRFRICQELAEMGAEVQTDGRKVKIRGGRLAGCRVRAGELRGGAALVIAALAAEGYSVVEGNSFIRRGYENLCGDLRAAGGLITEDTGSIYI